MTAPNIQIPSKPKTSGAATSGSQRDRRFMDTFWDVYKHPVRFPRGRPFCGVREFQSGSETESINAGFLQSDLQCGEYFCESPEMGQTEDERRASLASVWVAPWLPQGGKKYMTFNYRRKTITFDYVKGEQDELNALSTYFEAAALLAGKNGWGAIDPRTIPSFQVTSVMGMPPKLLPVWRAARAGDPWLMGAVVEPNERLAKILGLGKIQYFGGLEFGDAEYVAVPEAQVKEPIVTPQQVLTLPMDQVQAMINAALRARDESDAAKKEADKARMAKARSARKPAGASA